ncbi:hypothetical protein, partial [Salmonella enterica]|uniref:hypothetical protein n=1 Tax=Salmonella enterica TaxID=28901 RepID=UPI003D769185
GGARVHAGSLQPAGAIARALADGIVAAGGDRDWSEAVAAVPRHLFVPVHHVQRGGTWETRSGEDADRLIEVYRDQPLIT